VTLPTSESPGIRRASRLPGDPATTAPQRWPSQVLVCQWNSPEGSSGASSRISLRKTVCRTSFASSGFPGCCTPPGRRIFRNPGTGYRDSFGTLYVLVEARLPPRVHRAQPAFAAPYTTNYNWLNIHITQMPTTPLDDALDALGPGFLQEVRNRLAPVKDRFFQPPSRSNSDYIQRGDRIERKDGLITAPPYLADPELRKVAIELAELAIENGIDVNIVCETDGSTWLHGCVLLHDLATAKECVTWLLAHGADSNKVRDDGESPLSLAMKSGRTEIVKLMRRN
jgi:Ankyrin repeats (3 copies)